MTLWSVVLCALLGMGATGDCGRPVGGGGGGDEGPPPVPTSASVTLNAIPDDMNDLLVVPPHGFVINVSVSPGDVPLDPNLFYVWVRRWGSLGGDLLPMTLTPDLSGSVYVLPANAALDPGTYAVEVVVGNVEQEFAEASLDFAVRDFPALRPPIDSGQIVWFDLESDRDAVPGPDFAVDLEVFGLGSPAAPVESAAVEGWITEYLLDRVAEIYHGSDPNGLGPDPVDVTFTADDPGAGEVTRICVGGADPTGGPTIGSILIDPNNAQRISEECGTIPPTGVFPRELLTFSNDPDFQLVFDGLRPATGGVPVGEHALDPIVLDPFFDPATASAAELGRYYTIGLAICAFGDMLGTIVAHETAHALGLVPSGAPGVGLYGGSTGAAFNHNLTASGAHPAASFVMNSGVTYTFAKLAGLFGEPEPVFRPLNLAYLRDRVVVDASVTALWPEPRVDSVEPPLVASSLVTITITGGDFHATPSVRLVSPQTVYEAIGEQWLDENTISAIVIRSQLPTGVTYDLHVTNPDGQLAVLPGSVSVQ